MYHTYSSSFSSSVSYLSSNAVPSGKNVYHNAVAVETSQELVYTPGASFSSLYDSVSQQGYVSYQSKNTEPVIHEIFLSPDRPLTEFVNSSTQIEELTREVFTKLTGKELQNVSIHVQSARDFMEQHKVPGNVLGLAVQGSPALIYIKEDFLDRMLITIGHEIGHVFTASLSTRHNEEAKAFAFELAWVRCIRDHDIGGLGRSIVPTLPAHNGVHDVSFGFVVEKTKEFEPLELYYLLSNGELSFESIEDLII